MSTPTLVIFGLTTTLISQFARVHLALCKELEETFGGLSTILRTLPLAFMLNFDVVTVKGSHRALLWVFSVSGKYNRIFPRYPTTAVPLLLAPILARLYETAMAMRVKLLEPTLLKYS